MNDDAQARGGLLCYGKEGIVENGIMAQPSINFEVEIHVVERDSNIYAATIMPFHVTGYGDSFDGAIERAKEGLGLLLEEYEADGNLQQLLEDSGVVYTVTDEAPDTDSSVRRVREQIAYAGSR